MVRRKQKSKLATRASNINMVLLFLVLVIMAVMVAVVINAINNNTSGNLVRSYSLEAADKFYSYISQDLTLVRKASHSKAITSWFADEEDQAKKAAAFDEMKDYANISQVFHFYFAVNKSLNEYTFRDMAELADLVPSDRLDRASIDDTWYFECISSENEYTLNVDYEKFDNTWYMWINHKVMADGKLVGVFCLGLGIPNIFEDMFSSYDVKKVRGYIINKQGVIQSDSTNYTIYDQENVSYIQAENSDPAFAVILASYLGNIHGFFGSHSRPEVIKLNKGPYRCAAIEPIGNTDWSVVAFYNGNALSGATDLLPLLIVMLLTLFLYVIGRNALIRRLIFTPIERLIQSVSEGKSDDIDFYGKDRNDEIGDLARTIRDAEHALREAHEHNNLMLNVVPLGCSLLDKNGRAFDCNDAALKLFDLSDKQEYTDRFYDLSPEYQPDGSLSSEAIVLHVKNAFKNGKDVFEWMHQKLDGTPIPSEVTLVRVPYEGDYVVVGYMRDLREHNRMMRDIEKRDNLLNAINRIAAAMLSPTDNKSFEESLLDGMELMGRHLEADCVQIWPNETINDTLHFVLRYKWLSDAGLKAVPVKIGTAIPYSARWKELFLRGECINGPLSKLPKEDQDLLSPLCLKSTVTIPLFYQENFWGVFCLDDFNRERYFSDDEVDILRSAGLILVNAMNRNTQADQLRRAHDLLHTVNRVAAILLQSEIDQFEDILQQSMSMMGKALNADRVSIWKNNVKEGKLYCTQIIEWVSDPRLRTSREISTDVPYEGNIPTWGELMPQSKYINKLVRDLSPEEQARLAMYGVLSVFSTPVFVGEEFWGFVACDNCQSETVFSEDEASILRSGSILIANALLRNEMTQNLHTAADQLKDALKEAQKANEAKSSFLANMSHEMRTPLNAVIGLSELTLEDERLNEEALTNLEKINNAGATLLSTVNDILDISKIEAGKFEIISVEYDIPSLINDAITQSIMRIGEKPIQFCLNISENLPTRLRGDDLRVKQIINNLLSNAFKYTRKGTVELGVSCEREDDDSVWMTIQVRDTGIGIRPEDLSNLFTEYSKMDTAFNRTIEGTGLGLPITKRIAEMMEGSVNVESEYGKGSIFTVKIKQKFATNAVIGAEVVNSLKNFRYADQKRRRNSRMVRISLPYARVLVVDDVLINLDVARGMMKPYNMKIDCVTSGQEAIDAIRNEKVKYNAVFMDQMMPGMDGTEATRIIREEIGTEYAKTVPIIALTANAIVGNEEMFLDNGFQAFISKPIEIERLDSVIREWVRDKDHEMKSGETGADDEISLDIRSGKERRIFSDRRCGIDRRTIGTNIPGIDIYKGIERFDGNEESFFQVLRSYAVNTRPLLDIVKGVNQDNLFEYAITVHGIKSSSLGICAEIIGAKAEVLEKAAKEGNYGFVAANNTVFIDSIEKLIYGLEEMFKQIASETPKPKTDKPDIRLLSGLLAACEAYDMDGVDSAMIKIEDYEYESDDGLAVWLRENVDQMNFTKIKERLLNLIGQK